MSKQIEQTFDQGQDKSFENKASDRRGSNGKRGNGRRGRRGRGRGLSGDAKGGKMFNDVSFYTKNPIITDAFGKLPYSFITGARIPNGRQKRVRLATVLSYVVDWVVNAEPRFKLGGSGASYVNTKQSSILDQIKSILYTAMRRANAGSTNQITPIDVLMSNLLASIDIICNTVYIARLFKIVNTFSWRNRQIPMEMFRHMGLDYWDFVNNQALYRGKYDTLVAYAKTIRTLAKYPFIQAAYSEYMNIFKDEDTNTGREQIILSVKAFHHIYDPVGTTEYPGGSVRLMTQADVWEGSDDQVLMYTSGYKLSRSNPGKSVQLLLDILEKQIRALVDDADFNLIQADLEKAFGDSGYWEAAAVDVDVASGITPIYSGEFNAMFKNGNFMPMPGSYSQDLDEHFVMKNEYFNDIYQSEDTDDPMAGQKFINATGVAVCTNAGRISNDYDRVDKFNNIINDTSSSNNMYLGGFVATDVEDPTPADNIIMSRFKSMFIKTFRTNVPDTFKTANTEVSGIYLLFGSNFITFGNMLSYVDYDSDAPSPNWISWDGISVNGEMNSQVWLDKLLLNHFKLTPLVFFLAEGTPLESGLFSLTRDVNNVRFFDQSEIRAINEACFLSLWNLPDKTNI